MFDPNAKSWDDELAPKVLPPGEHVVFIAEAVIVESKHKGTPGIEITFQCHDPASAYRGQNLKFQTFWLSEKAMPRLVRLCRAAGVNKPFDTADQDQVDDALLDRILSIKVKSDTDTYDGKSRTRTEAAFFNGINASEKARLVEEYGESMLPPLEDDGSGGGGGEAPSFDDDEIPF